MSLILEALRKSEAERRRGELPSLHAELPPPPPSVEHRPRLPKWALPAMALTAGMLVLALWWQTRAPAPISADSRPAVQDTRRAATAPSAAATAAANSTSAPAAAPALAPDNAPAAESPAPPAVATTPTPVAPTELPVAPPTAAHPAATTSMPAATPPGAAVTAAADTPAPKPAEDSAKKIAKADKARLTAVDGDTADVLKEIEREAQALQAEHAADAPEQPAVAKASPKAVTASAPAAANAHSMSLGDLDPQTRASLPTLKISMHMWNAQPQRRIAIIDGQRVGEGDRIAGMTVTRIQPDAVLLDWNGQALRLPVR